MFHKPTCTSMWTHFCHIALCTEPFSSFLIVKKIISQDAVKKKVSQKRNLKEFLHFALFIFFKKSFRCSVLVKMYVRQLFWGRPMQIFKILFVKNWGWYPTWNTCAPALPSTPLPSPPLPSPPLPSPPLPSPPLPPLPPKDTHTFCNRFLRFDVKFYVYASWFLHM